MTTVVRTIVATLLLAVLPAGGAAAEPRFRITAQLQAEAPLRDNGRFGLRAALVPAAPRPDPHTRFQLRGSLDSGAKAACMRPDAIFGNGFEDP